MCAFVEKSNGAHRRRTTTREGSLRPPDHRDSGGQARVFRGLWEKPETLNAKPSPGN